MPRFVYRPPPHPQQLRKFLPSLFSAAGVNALVASPAGTAATTFQLIQINELNATYAGTGGNTFNLSQIRVNQLVMTAAAVSWISGPAGQVGTYLTGPQQDTKLVRFDDVVQFRIDVAFETPFPLMEPQWTSVSTDVMRFSISRGRAHAFAEHQPAKLDVVLDNRKSLYDAKNTLSPHNSGPAPRTPFQDPGSVGNSRERFVDAAFDSIQNASPIAKGILPMRQVRVQGVVNGSTFDLFKGWVDGWNQTIYKGGTPKRVQMAATDGHKILALLRTSATFASTKITERLGDLLDDAGWPTDWRDLPLSTNVTQADLIARQPVDASVANEIQRSAKSVAGFTLFRPNGNFGANIPDTSGNSFRGGTTRHINFKVGPFLGLDYQQMVFRSPAPDSLYSGIIWNTAGDEPDESSINEGQEVVMLRRLLKISGALTTGTTAQGSYVGASPLFNFDDWAVDITTEPRTAPTSEWVDLLTLSLDQKFLYQYDNSVGIISRDLFVDSIRHKVDVNKKRWVTTVRGSKQELP